MSGAGYSGTPLPAKLGFKPGMTAAFLDALDAVISLLGDLDGVTVRRRLGGHLDLVLCFVTERAALARRATALRRAAHPDGMVWICWPKKAAKVPTDVTEDVLRDVILPLGLVDRKVCAIDATWSGLLFSWRKQT